jgi:hypothetical protein
MGVSIVEIPDWRVKMSYAVYDSTGYRGDFASIGGLADLRQWAEQQKNQGVLQFLNDGHADPEDVLNSIPKEPKGDPSVLKTLEGLTKLAKISQDIIIINDGLE